ncbi:MAG TPA: porin [Myxococcota bacterium]|nr:porin [Myxococcota bacterium]
MTRIPLAGAILLALTATSHAETPQPEPPKKPDRKLELTSRDGAQKVRIGGQLQVDALVFPSDTEDTNIDDVRLRRARLDVRSQIARDYRLRIQLDFANSNLQIVDANLELTHIEELRIRAGKDKSPVSVDRGQSATVMHFLERGATNQTAPNRDIGLQVFGAIADGLVDYQLGLFAGAPDGATSVESNVDDRFDVAGRVTFAPWEPLEIGVTFSHGVARGSAAAPQLGAYRTSGRAAWFRYLDGDGADDTVVADGARNRLGGHLSFHLGPIGLFGEVIASSQALSLGATRGTVTHIGWVGQVSGVLTGEDASFSGVTPTRAVWDGGPGAVELAVRVHGIDVDDRAFSRGFADPERYASAYLALTVGATWYLDPHFKVQLNYERSSFDGGAPNGFDRPAEDLLGMRLQHLF